MGRVAVFVDAGYFWVQACQAVLGRIGTRNEISVNYSELRESLLNAVNQQTSGVELLRVYWYDGPGQSGKGPDHESIDDLDDFKLRLGTRNFKGQQKAVDGLIIADMLNLTQSKAIDHAVLVSGDADLTPGVTAAQALGLRVHLVILDPRAATSPYLAAEADGKLFLPADWVRKFASARATVPASTAVIGFSTSPAAQPFANVSPSVSHLMPFDAIAQRVHANLLNGPLAGVVANLSKGPGILPKEIDGRLLYEGKAEAGRFLTETEKRSLRSAFKKLI